MALGEHWSWNLSTLSGKGSGKVHVFTDEQTNHTPITIQLERQNGDIQELNHTFWWITQIVSLG